MSLQRKDDSVLTSFLCTFERWDGSYLPCSSMNLTKGDWPYLVKEDSSSYTISRKGQSVTLPKMYGLSYDFRPQWIKEVITLDSPSSKLLTAIASKTETRYLITLPFSSSYSMTTSGLTN